MTDAAPKSLSDRLERVGPAIFGPRGWTARLASGLGTSRSILSEYRNGRRSSRDIDSMMLDLIDREQDAAAERS